MSDHPLVYRVLNECEVMLGHALTRTTIPGRAVRDVRRDVWRPAEVSRYELAVWRVSDELAPGFSDRTPGNGDPGAGKGASVTSRGVDDNEGPDAHTQPERIVVAGGGWLPELADHRQLRYSPLRVFGHTSVLVRSVDPTVHVTATVPARGPLQRLEWSLGSVRNVLGDPVLVERCTLGRCRAVHRAVEDMDRLVRRYGYEVTRQTATAAEREMLATDLTETLCRSCLRVGRREPRYRGDLCQWCYRFQTSEGFLPPADVIEVRGRYGTVTDAMVEPHRKRHRDRQRPRRRA